jgi:hypothetical protein
MLDDQTTVLLLPFIRGEGRDEGLLVGVRILGQSGWVFRPIRFREQIRGSTFKQ